MAIRTPIPELTLREATECDCGLILSFIRELAEYEKRAHEVVATEDLIRRNLFTERRCAEAIIAEWQGAPVGFALFFHNFSTFLGRPGIYVEDIYVRPEMRRRGIGRAMLAYLARLAVSRGCGRLEWWVLDWNEPALRFYQSIGAVPMSDWTVQRLTGEALTRLAAESPGAQPG